jgi:lactoylglutathione lyase
MPEAKKARAVGLNHVALEVGNIDEALAFYGQLFDFKIRGRSETAAFIDLGDQFLALQQGRTQPADDGRHFGLVVDDRDAVRRALANVDIEPLPGRFLDFLDPWGNRIEIIAYENIQFTKASLHLPLPSSHDLVGVLGPVVLAQSLLVASAEPELPPGGPVGQEPVGHEDPR